MNVAISQKKMSCMIFDNKNDRTRNKRKSWELTVCIVGVVDRFGHKLFRKGETCMISVYPNLIDRTKGSTIVCLSECSTIYYYILDFSCFTLFADYWWDWVIAVPNMAQCHRQSCRKSKWDRWQSYMYTPSTLNIVLIQWHTHWNVCAVK